MRYRGTHRFFSLVVAITLLITVNSYVYADDTAESAETAESTEAQDFDIEEEIVYEENVVIDNGYDNDFLAEQFIAQQMSVGSEPLLRSYNYASQLSDYNLMLFTALQPHIIAVANGTESSTIFVIDIGSVTAADLGLESITTEVNSQEKTVFTKEVKDALYNYYRISTDTVVHALLNACPYDLYWYDKTAGCSVRQSFSLSNDVLSISYTFQFSVAQEYAGSSAYTVDTSMYGQALRDAVVNARVIIDRYAADSDYDKLLAYRNEICSLTSYNDAAADRDNNTPYGNPWQMIWVFDGDPNTTVVCEGYSKAFQFLCDNSIFQNDIYAICVSGSLYTYFGTGGLMWNIVHMEDVNNYLVDVTNCDTGHDLFLRGWSEEASNYYQVPGIALGYSYNDNTLAYYSNSDLTLNTVDYEPVHVTGVTLDQSDLSMTAGGETTRLVAMVLPDNAADKSVTWSSNNESVATVSSTGVVTPLSAGSATITVTTDDGSFTAACNVTVTAPVTPVEPVEPVAENVDMYRLYNPNSGEHFYTSNAGERDLLASLGWHDEGIGWIAPATSNTPVYRLYNENGGEHHYTTSIAERDMLVSLGWNDEGIGWYSDDAHTVPLYRQYNPNSFANNHNYTTSLGENHWLVSIGWRAEGIGWYGVG